MCDFSNYITLTETAASQITWCKGCRTFSLSYKCCCASFTEIEMRQFCSVLRELRGENYSYMFNDKPHTIIKGPCGYIGFCLSEEDTIELIRLTSEALSIFQAFKIIYS